MSEVVYAWTRRGKAAHIAAGPGKRVACQMFIKAHLFTGTEIPEGKHLCIRCQASQGNVG